MSARTSSKEITRVREYPWGQTSWLPGRYRGPVRKLRSERVHRSVIPTEQMPEDLRWNAATLWAGAKCHLVHYPLSGWKVFNLAITCHNDPAEAFAARPVTHEEVLEGFRDVHPRAKAIIHHGEDWKAWVTCDRDP